MKRVQRTSDCCDRKTERGQVLVIVLVVLGFFLLAVSAFGVDMANFWFHRQAAQGAADAACTAGVMDMLVNANTGSTLGGFPGGDFNCSPSGSPGAAPCQYAALNGYNGDGLTPGNTVQVRFVATSSITGIDTNAIPGVAPNALEVEITERVQTFFSGLLTGNTTQAVRVRSRCAVLKAQAPVPITVLNPICSTTLDISGSATIEVVGGPNQSIQVNSSSTTSVSAGHIDLDHGGPAFTGSLMGVFGGPATAPGGFLPGTTGAWNYPSAPISDPYGTLTPPTVPGASPTDNAPISVTYPDGVYGCPDHSGCKVYKPGLYTHPIVVKGLTAVFVPGLYYFNIPAGNYDKDNCPDGVGCVAKPTGQCNYALTVDSNGVVRMAIGTEPGDGSRGITMYLSGPGGANGYGSVFFGSNAGNSGGRTVDNYDTTSTTTGIKCPGGTDPNPGLGLPSTVPGNVLLGPCTQDATFFSSTTNASTVGKNRGILFFADRHNGNNDGQPSMQGGGGLLLVGNMYFHHCPSWPAVCNPTTEYKAMFQLQGNPSSGTYLLGNISTDALGLGGSATISMQLDTSRTYTILKATLVQ